MNQEFINGCEYVPDYGSLYDDFISSWMSSPTALISTPGFGKKEMTVVDVVADDFAGEKGSADEIELLRIIAEVAKTQTALGDRARAVMHNIAHRHASFHLNAPY